MTRKEAVEIFLKQVQQAYIEDQQRKNIRASGKSAASMRTESGEQGGKLFGAGYFYFQFQGRKSGKFPPIESIIQWIRDKKTFQVEDKASAIKSLAFLIARKIAKNGTDIAIGKRPGLNVEDQIATARKELCLNLAVAARDKYITKLNKLKLTTA